MEILDQLDITFILESLDNCPEAAMHEVDEWISPTAKQTYNLYRSGHISKNQLIERLKKIKNPEFGDSSREQNRLHVLWQMTEPGSILPWWEIPDWSSKSAILNPIYGKYFTQTVDFFKLYLKQKNKKLERMFFSRLLPGKQVYPHSDSKRTDGRQQYRVGLVLTTNDDALLTVEDRVYQLDPGTLFVFDNLLIHGATNFGNTPRTILYMDVS